MIQNKSNYYFASLWVVIIDLFTEAVQALSQVKKGLDKSTNNGVTKRY